MQIIINNYSKIINNDKIKKEKIYPLFTSNKKKLYLIIFSIFKPKIKVHKISIQIIIIIIQMTIKT